ncbi:MAG: hypothetical protein AB8H79_04265, partial [Myxococcota bacterium]
EARVATDDNNPLRAAKDKLIREAAASAAKSALDQVTQRANDAVDGALSDAEGWVGKAAEDAEKRRSDSGLPSTSATIPDWAESLEQDSEDAFQRGRALDADEPASPAPDDEARAKIKEQLARMKQALAEGRDPLLVEADRVLDQAQTTRAATASPMVSLEDELDHMAAQAAADAGASVARAPEDTSRPTLTPIAEPVSEEPEEPASADSVDPALAALAAAKAARRGAADDPSVFDEPATVVDDVEAILARARAARAKSGSPSSKRDEDVRAEARARVARIADEAFASAQSTRIGPSDEPELIAPPAPPSDPLAAAEAMLARAKRARQDAGTDTSELDAIRQRARDKIAKILEEPSSSALHRARNQMAQQQSKSAADLAAEALAAGQAAREEREALAQRVASRRGPHHPLAPTLDEPETSDDDLDESTPPKRRL